MPFVFNVITKILSKAINKKIWGVLMIYVDDLMGITHVDHLEDMRIAHDIGDGFIRTGCGGGHKNGVRPEDHTNRVGHR